MDRGTDIDKYSRVKSPKSDPHKHAQLTFVKNVKAVPYRKESLFNEWLERNWTLVGKNEP
jgi:hypothetical protein